MSNNIIQKTRSFTGVQDDKLLSVESQPDFIQTEKELLDWWDSAGIVKKYLDRNNASDRYYSFLDGPITANNPMGVHHAWGRTYKDIWQRYKNMQGFRQRFQNGFDCQGLWVEVEVEKELGLHSKRDIENLVPGDPKASIAKFVQLCKERVEKYSAIQTEQSKRLGYFMDWENSYFTMSEENNYMIWKFLKKCFDNGQIYKGHDSVPWCPRCGTAISQHEMLTEDYKEATHESIYILYPIINKDTDKETGEHLLVWTTTPWTLPANVAVAVDPNAVYVQVQVPTTAGKQDKTIFLGKEAAVRLGLETTSELKGSELVGLEYESPFDHLPRVKSALGDYKHRVVATDSQIMPITNDEGTGLVHTAPGAGTEDFQLGKKLGLPVIEVIDEEANYLADMDDFSGKNAKKHPELIIEFLKEKDGGKFLFKTENITHRYPACWRCKTELVWRVVDEWYVSMDKPSQSQNSKIKGQSIRESMKDVAKDINWLPEFGLKRELDWLDNMHDWLISKKRYWGLALPIWVCDKCDTFTVVGGKEELKEKAVEGWDAFEENTPHRPFIDEIKLKCECGGVMTRIPDVGNPWLDAGIVPFSTITNAQGVPLYNTDHEEWKKWFPADFITESFPGQFKNWFYSLIAMSTVLEGAAPTKTILGFATLLAEDGRPMHKTAGNSIEFNEGADKIGVDVMRWMYAKQDPATNMLFGYKTADEVRRRFLLILWNSYKYFLDYVGQSGWSCENTPSDVREKMTVLDRWVLARLTQVVLLTNKSLENYDSATAARNIEEFIVNDLSTWYIRRSRDRVGAKGDKNDEQVFLSVMYGVLVTLTKLLAPFMPYVSESMFRNLTGEESVHLQDYPKGDSSLLDEKLVADMEVVRKIAEKGHAARKLAQIAVRQPLGNLKIKSQNAKLDDELLQLVKDELNIKEVEWYEVTDKDTDKGDLEVELDTIMTPELEEEGKARDLARQIQEKRKELKTPLNAKVNVVSPWIPTNPELVEWVKLRTLADELVAGPDLLVTVIE